MAQQDSSGSFTANAQTQPMNVSALRSLILTITGTFNLTLQFEGSVDGTNWVSVRGFPLPSGVPVTSITGTGVGTWRFSVAGFRLFRLRVSAYTSGTMVYALWATDTDVIEDSAGQPAVSGTAAHDAAAVGNPVQVGAVCRTDNPITIANGDMSSLMATSARALVTKPFQIPENDWQYAAAAAGILNTTTAVAFKAAAGASLRNYITAIQVMAEALTNATELAIRDGAAGTVIWRTKIPTGGLLNGLSVEFPTPLKGTANTLLEVVTLTASGAGAVFFNAQGYVAP